MFAKETYVQRRALLKKNIGSGVLLFLGNDEQGLHYEDNTFRYRQDSTFLYYFGSGPVRGFAVTLAIGIATSMFTSVTVTRLIIASWIAKYKPTKLPI